MRSKGIGGTDIGAIIGVNPWKTKMDVYLEKVGITEGPEDNEAMYWGREMEPVLAKRYIKETDHKVFSPLPGDLPFIHNYFYWYLGSPDGLVGDFKYFINTEKPITCEGGVDYKTTGRRDDYGASGTDAVPDYVATQCHWYMGLTGAQWWDVAVLFMGYRREFHIYHLERNQEIIDNLVEAGRDFWENHVVPQVPPELDASDASKTLLRTLYPDSMGEVLPAPESAYDWRTKLTIANQMIKDYEEQKKLAQHHLEALVGDADALLWPDGAKFSWRKNKDSKVVDWENLAMSFLPTPDQMERFTKIKPGPRVPRLWLPKEKK